MHRKLQTMKCIKDDSQCSPSPSTSSGSNEDNIKIQRGRPKSGRGGRTGKTRVQVLKSDGKIINKNCNLFINCSNKHLSCRHNISLSPVTAFTNRSCMSILLQRVRYDIYRLCVVRLVCRTSHIYSLSFQPHY